MAATRIIVIGVAVAAAIGAGLLAMNLTRPEAPPPQIVNNAPVAPTTRVLIAKQDIQMGTKLRNKLAWQDWPNSGVTGNFITENSRRNAIDELAESIARTPISNGEPIRDSKITGGTGIMSAILPPGYRAVATNIDADSAAGGFILPNDFVDVIMTRRAEDGTQRYITETILQNVKVLAIDQTLQMTEDGKESKLGSTATLELTPEQAEIITVAQEMSGRRLRLALRSVADSQEKPTSQADYLVSKSGATGKSGSIRIIKQGEVTEVGARK